jgi:hypothetical protein
MVCVVGMALGAWTPAVGCNDCRVKVPRLIVGTATVVVVLGSSVRIAVTNGCGRIENRRVGVASVTGAGTVVAVGDIHTGTCRHDP